MGLGVFVPHRPKGRYANKGVGICKSKVGMTQDSKWFILEDKAEKKASLCPPQL
jgi:hypothetical protein